MEFVGRSSAETRSSAGVYKEFKRPTPAGIGGRTEAIIKGERQFGRSPSLYTEHRPRQPSWEVLYTQVRGTGILGS